MELLFQIVVVLLVAGLLWWALQPQYIFLVRIREGLPSVAHGRVTGQFMHELSEILETFGVSRGWVGGVARGNFISLRFSGNIPPGCRQRLRNLWPLCK